MKWRFVAAAIDEVISPELVLVSTPEVAAEARAGMPDPIPLRYVAHLTISRREWTCVYAGLSLVTLGPYALAAVAAH
jgi:hypothetical protein